MPVQTLSVRPKLGRNLLSLVAIGRKKGFIFAVVLGLLDYWLNRFVIFSDGIPYLEIARRYAEGDWKRAINAYWSPLYSWALAVARLMISKNDRWELASLHVANLVAYLVALFLFERLLSRIWPNCRSNGATIRCRCFRVCSYCLFLWTTLHMIGIRYCSPDMFVLALNLVVALLLLRIQEKPHSYAELALLSSVLALSYLCKAAFFPISFVYFAVALWLGKKQGRTLARATALFVPFLVLCTPWFIALHHHQGYWTIGEAGKLNYAWEVDQAARSMHWQGEPGNIGKPLHPTRHIFSNPDVYEFGSAIDATFPPWFDPSYWYAGVAPGLHIRNQLRALAICVPYVLVLLCLIPGGVPAVLIAVFTGRGSYLSAAFRKWSFLLVPAFAPLLLYSLVFVDTRYIGGSVLVIGLVVLRSALPLLKASWQFNLTRCAASIVCTIFVLFWIAGGLIVKIWITNPPYYTNQQALIASEARALGLKKDDQVAYIGFGMNAYWALLDNVKITAEIPPSFDRNGKLSNLISENHSNIDEFWKADASTRDRIFAKLKSSGIRAVVADGIPEGKASTDWIKLKGQEVSGERFVNVYIKFL